MKPAAFAYVRPASLDEAIQLLASDKDEALPIAGGQSLMPLLALRMTRVDRIVDIGRLEALRRVEDDKARVMIGAGITHAEIEDGAVPDPAHGLMQRIARGIAYRSIRHRGTIGGSVALADPAADWPACLIALNAVAQISGPNANRSMPVNELIEGTFTTRLDRRELIVAFDIPRLSNAGRVGLAKVARKTGAFAMSLAVVVADGHAGTRVVLGGAGSRPSLLQETAKAMRAGKVSDVALGAAIASDLAGINVELDDYGRRLHTATIRSAVAEAGLQ